MEVPCPVPLQNAWSPVGYQVVEENIPLTQDARVTADGPLPEPPCLPSSPVGYRVTEVAAEDSAPRPARRAARAPLVQPKSRQARASFLGKTPPLILWGPCAAGGAAVLVAMLLIIAIRMSSPAPEAPARDAGPVVLPPVLAAARPDAPAKPDVPAKPDAARKADAEQPAPRKPAPAVPDGPVNLAGIVLALDEGALPGAGCKVPRDNFGTTVQFARNPGEANHMAAEARKLTFMLHVSGNFEEARFT
jgi:hypothetical protein